MLQKSAKRRTLLGTALALIAACIASGCAAGITRVNISHEPLDRIDAKKSGTVLVRQFVDKRQDTRYIGNKRNGFGMVLGNIGTQENVRLETELTNYFMEALNEAGYHAVILAPDDPLDAPGQVKAVAVLYGRIIEFWLDLYMMVWHNVEVKLKALDPSTQAVLWESDIQADQKNVLWLGISGEYERVISGALTKALNRAAAEFAAADFNPNVN